MRAIRRKITAYCSELTAHCGGRKAARPSAFIRLRSPSSAFVRVQFFYLWIASYLGFRFCVFCVFCGREAGNFCRVVARAGIRHGLRRVKTPEYAALEGLIHRDSPQYVTKKNMCADLTTDEHKSTQRGVGNGRQTAGTTILAGRRNKPARRTFRSGNGAPRKNKGDGPKGLEKSGKEGLQRLSAKSRLSTLFEKTPGTARGKRTGSPRPKLAVDKRLWQSKSG